MVYMVWVYGFTGVHSFTFLTLFAWFTSTATPPHTWFYDSHGVHV